MPYSTHNKANNYFSHSIKTILITAVLVLLLNFACANGTGVHILAIFGSVPTDQVTNRLFILQGVELMQLIIKIVAFLGLSFFTYFMYSGFRLRRRLANSS